jgi:hypothetical protein
MAESALRAAESILGVVTNHYRDQGEEEIVAHQL